MKRLTLPLAVVVVSIAAASSARAQCAFDGPSKAKGFKTNLVRAFAPCPSITFPAPNSQTGTGVPTCAPPKDYSLHNGGFIPRGSGCSVSAKAKLESPCSAGIGTQDCMNIALKAQCTGVTFVDGITPTNEPGWSLNIVARATIDDPDFGDMTTINYPVNIVFPQPVKGKFSLKANTSSILLGLGLEPLPACSEVEIVSLSIKDPDDHIFAKIGAGTRPFGF